jgi:hypothetical protein
MGRREGAGVYALLGSSQDLGDDARSQSVAVPSFRFRSQRDGSSSYHGDNRGRESGPFAHLRGHRDSDPALRAEEHAAQREQQSVLRRSNAGDHNSLRMADVRFEQLHANAVAEASRSLRFAVLAAKQSVELPQFTFNKAHVASQAQKYIDGLGDFGNYGVKLSIFRSNVRGAENDVKAAASEYSDAVADAHDAQKQAMRMLHTLGPRVDRWFQASLSIVKLQRSLAAAHALDQKALSRFVRAAQGTVPRAA